MADEGFNRLKECRHGRMLYNVNDIFIGRSLDLYGEFSEGELHLLARYLRPGDHVIDVGANIGAHTLAFAKMVRPGGMVFAFEPQRLIFQTLCANLALNDICNVVCFQQGLGEQAGQLHVPVLDPFRRQNFGGVALADSRQGDVVPLLPLDRFNLDNCRLIKIDVEGMEAAVLKGARQFIARTRPILYVENDRPERSKELLMIIAALGYRAYMHYPPLFSADNFAGHAANVFGNVMSKNLLCLPPGETISDLLPAEMP